MGCNAPVNSNHAPPPGQGGENVQGFNLNNTVPAVPGFCFLRKSSGDYSCAR